MPVHEVLKNGKLIGYQWGNKGKIYLISSYGKEQAKMKANKQGEAAYANGYNKKL